MSHSGPLQDLSLAYFIPSSAGSSTKTSTITKLAKRPLSPSQSTIYSPAKRRILRSEGILLPGEGTPSFFLPRLPSSKSDVFGATHASSTSLTPLVKYAGAAQGFSRNRRSSRRLSPKSTRQCSNIASGDDSASALNVRRSSRLQSSQPRATPIAILREIPPPHDRQSVHYPGFDTYQDTHIFLVPPRQTGSPSDDENSSSEGILSEREISKENIPPCKKAKKSSLAQSSVPMSKSFRSN